MQGFEGQIAGAAEDLDLIEQAGEGKANPRDHHRPGLDAAQAVDALLQRPAEQAVDIEGDRLFNQAVDGQGPGAGAQPLGISGRVILGGTELIEVVVAGHLVFGRQFTTGPGPLMLAEVKGLARRLSVLLAPKGAGASR